MKIKHIIYVLLTIAIIGFIGYRITENKSANTDSKDPKGKVKSINVTRIVATPQTFDNNLSLSGSIEANEQVEIRSAVSGIRSYLFLRRQHRTQRTGTFKVNDLELRAQLRQTSTSEGLASENERRAKLLLQKEAISQEEYDLVRADLKSAQAQSQLIKAPISKISV